MLYNILLTFFLIGTLHNYNDCIRLQIKYAQEEIDIKIELIKNELDLLKCELINKMNNLKTEFNK